MPGVNQIAGVFSDRASVEFAAVKHVLAPVAALPPGSQGRFEVNGRPIAVFNADGTYFALRDACPHQGAALSAGLVVGHVSADEPGCYDYEPSRKRVRCPWHGWEYDLATGQSWYDPARDRVRAFEVSVESGADLQAAGGAPDGLLPGPYNAETFRVSVEDEYVVIEI
jgi:3-phenylpropionate/trans-cinnamate dioxygenase ferredoxin subunit